MKYNPSKIEKKWQRIWEESEIYKTKDSAKGKRNYLLLTEFPYPSGNLHIGHWFAFSVPDILARYLRMKGLNVMYPMGFDAFGLPAENAAIQRNINPADWTRQNISYMTKQLKSMGATFDWSRKVETTDPEYYKWTQWMFLKFYENGLAYREKTKVNWCPKDKTVLANEQVVDNCCERCGSPVVQKELVQWMFKITKYADRLYEDIEGLDWPETTKLAQKNWIGRSEGALIKFQIPNSKSQISVFTTRPDTIFGATFLVLAPEHELVKKIVKDQFVGQVNNYLEKTRKKTELERMAETKDKTGVFTGAYAFNPVNGEKIPVWISDFVLSHYGAGAVMAVPAHDQRDFEFAQKFNLPIKMVICPNYPDSDSATSRNGDPATHGSLSKKRLGGTFDEQPKCPILDKAFSEDGYLVDSGKFTGMKSAEARKKITENFKEKGLAEFKTTYRLHDWILSRQRYWGVPIPMIVCQKCGYLPVSEKDLPVKLPPLKDFKPADDGRSPLAKAKEWMKVRCPKCNGEAERETDTMDTFVDSSWYFMRYTDSKNKRVFADKKKMENWLPVPMYIGGAEHNTMHLLYSRFFTKALYELGYVNFSEPFSGRRNHGVILGPDSQKMSKSKGNVIDPDEMVEKFGSDAVRMYLCFMGPYENGGPWDPKAIVGVYRFLNRVWNLINPKSQISKSKQIPNPKSQNGELERVFHKAIKKIGEDIENLRFNTAVSELMKLLNEIEDYQNKGFTFQVPRFKTFLKLLAPFAPHLAEEIWRGALGNKKSIHLEKWPKYDPELIKEEMVDLIIQINGRTRDIIKAPRDITESEARKLALASEKIKKHTMGGEIKKFIFISNKLVNLVM